MELFFRFVRHPVLVQHRAVWQVVGVLERADAPGLEDHQPRAQLAQIRDGASLNSGNEAIGNFHFKSVQWCCPRGSRSNGWRTCLLLGLPGSIPGKKIQAKNCFSYTWGYGGRSGTKLCLGLQEDRKRHTNWPCHLWKIVQVKGPVKKHQSKSTLELRFGRCCKKGFFKSWPSSTCLGQNPSLLPFFLYLALNLDIPATYGWWLSTH